ncbi:hypothetical protein I4U23_027171 [Adineta vaga]|nr:hypothetical protein I4U23_027171 [Adineta vaga]
MSMSSRIKEQICSLHLSNENTCYPIHLFLSKFSLLDFSYLHSLTLTELTENDWKQIQLTLPLLSQLTFFRNVDLYLPFDIASDLPLSQLQTLILHKSLPHSISPIQYSSLFHLTLSECTMRQLYELLNDLSKLMYFKTNRVFLVQRYENLNLKNDISTKTKKINLKELYIGCFENEFYYLEMILRQTTILEKLTIRNDIHDSIVDVKLWEELINSSLPHLNIFKFEFKLSEKRFDKIIDIFKQFQSDFWCNEHHWYTDYFIFRKSRSIYTIPYPFHTFQYTGENNKHVDSFDNVTDLSIFSEMLPEKSQFYFPNVISLSIQQTIESWNGEYYKLTDENAKCLFKMINLSNIKHLLIENIFFESSSIFEDILKGIQQLSSLCIKPNILIKHFDDYELCKYLNKSIKKLKTYFSFYNNSEDIERFCEIFSNLEELWCGTNKSNVLFLIKNLPKLIYIDIIRDQEDYLISEIEIEVQKLGLDITYNSHGKNYIHRFSIWINRNTYVRTLK